MSKKPLSPADRMRAVADASRFFVDRAREAFDDVADTVEELRTVIDADISTAVDTVLGGLDDLESILGADVIAEAREALETVQNLLDVDLYQTVVEAYEQVESALDEVEGHRDDPSSYDADTKESARDTAREALHELAEALDSLPDSTTVHAPVQGATA